MHSACMVNYMAEFNTGHICHAPKFVIDRLLWGEILHNLEGNQTDWLAFYPYRLVINFSIVHCH